MGNTTIEGSLSVEGYYYGDGSKLTGISSLDSTKVLKSGDIMYGPLHMSGTTYGLIIDDAATYWPFAYNSALAPAIPADTGMCFDLTSQCFEFNVGGNPYFQTFADQNTLLATIVSGADTFDGTALIGAPGYWQTRGLFQATDNGEAFLFCGLWARADTTRDPSEAVAFIAENVGAGSYGFNVFSGSAGENAAGNLMLGYTDNAMLQISQLSGTGGPTLTLDQNGADYLIDGTTNSFAVNAAGLITSDRITGNSTAHYLDLPTLTFDSAITINTAGNPITIGAFGAGGGWIDMPVGTASGLGSGGAGANAWLGYAGNNGDWLSDSLVGDICYRNTAGRLVFGTNGIDMMIATDESVYISHNLSVEGSAYILGSATVEGNFNVKGEMMGARMIQTFVKATGTADGYFSVQPQAMSATWGVPMPRNGSIVGLSWISNASVLTTSGEVQVQVRIDDTPTFIATREITATGIATVVRTQTRNISTFTAGQFIDPYVDLTTFVGTLSLQMLVVEIQFDN